LDDARGGSARSVLGLKNDFRTVCDEAGRVLGFRHTFGESPSSCEARISS